MALVTVQKCVVSCASNTYEADSNGRLMCVTSCPAGKPVHEVIGGFSHCLDFCSSSTQSNTFTLLDGVTCAASCPSSFFVRTTPGGKTLDSCVAACESPNQFIEDTANANKKCLSSCPFYTTVSASSFQCAGSCSQKYELDLSGNKHCLSDCSQTIFNYFLTSSSDAAKCVSNCATTAPIEVADGLVCMASCPPARQFAEAF